MAKHWEGAEVYDASQRFAGYDLYVFQKAYLSSTSLQFIVRAAQWRDEGKCRLAFDLCDADFLDWTYKNRMLDVLPMFDFCVGATDPITDWLKQYNYAYTIPDCVDVEAVRAIGTATHTDTVTPFLVWAGYENNQEPLMKLLPIIGRLGWPLEIVTVKSSIPFEEYWQRVLTSGDGTPHDILLNPQSDTGKYRYKSDNKTMIAHALGMSVATCEEDLRQLADPAERAKEKPTRPVSLAVDAWKKLMEVWL
ncbi:hypothetical protein D4Q85_01060 [bacterium]|nr:MAG: hypothetical protein D4Q85_01060 [bacterium]